MRHFKLADWTDFVRGVGDRAVSVAMAAHLESGCSRCDALARSARRLAEDAASMAAPPEAAVRWIEAYFRVQQPRRLNRLAARLAFDSRLAPLPVGTRSQSDYSRHLVYNARDYTLDVRMDYSPLRHEMQIVGQILRRHGMPLPNVPTFLISGDRLVSRSITGRLGEFQMDCRARGGLRLCFSVNSEDLIEVELDRRQWEEDPAADTQHDPISPHDPRRPQN